MLGSSLPPPLCRRVLGTIEEKEREHNSPEEDNTNKTKKMSNTDPSKYRG
jgi:hypothetical protein